MRLTKITNEAIGRIGKVNFISKSLSIKSNFWIKRLDAITKTAILLVLAGYKQKDRIEVFDKDLNRFVDMNKFANLNLNFKFAPKKFDVKLKFIEKNWKTKSQYIQKKVDVILLLSGGIDSVAGLLYCLDNKLKVLPLWIDFGQKNAKTEQKSVNKISKKLHLRLLKVKINLKDYVDKGWKKWEMGIIPARNFLFLSFAELFVSITNNKKVDVYLCAGKDEINKKHNDKSPEFYKLSSKLLSKFTRKKIRVTTPFYNFNKAEIMGFWDKKWKNKFGVSIKDTTTCYLGNNCGLCTACYYRKINGVVSGVLDNKFINNPFEDHGRIIRDYYLKNFKKWSFIRKVDFMIALSKNIDKAPKEVRKFYLDNEKRYKKYFSNRVKSIKKINISINNVNKSLNFFN